MVELARANLAWGYTKFRDALRTGLKIEIRRATEANILADAGIEPAPERDQKRTWKQFMKMHWESLYACSPRSRLARRTTTQRTERIRVAHGSEVS